jgi:hypothetical protein
VEHGRCLLACRHQRHLDRLRLRAREVHLQRWAIIALALVALGFLLTFPPMVELLAKH